MPEQQTLLPETLQFFKMVCLGARKKGIVSSVGWFTVPTYFSLRVEENQGGREVPFPLYSAAIC